MYIHREIDLEKVLSRKSLFLFGPRQTGKSTLVRKTLHSGTSINLLDHQTFLKLTADPTWLRTRLPAPHSNQLVIIDEIQRVPELLNEVHLQIEENGMRFLLTGSSARKLRRGGVNLLGGRALNRSLLPLSACELDPQPGSHSSFDLEKALLFGTLPSIWFSEEPAEDLAAYVEGYITQEIMAESLARSIPSFSRFLFTAAACNTQQVNFTAVASDAAVPRTTVHSYFQILEDTLLGNLLEPFRKETKRKAVSSPKFYFFDLGVTNAILGRKQLSPGTREFGECFEAFIHHELRCYISYKSPLTKMTYWRTSSGHEVDFILDDSIAIECKAKSRVTPQDLRGLRALQEENAVSRLCLVYLGTTKERHGDIEVWPWKEFLQSLREQ